MEIITKDIKFCALCNNYRGSVEEKYNGKVPVHCACTLEEEKIKYGHWRSPCMICSNGSKFWWIPISDHKVLTGLIKIINRRLRCYCDTHNSSHLLCRKCVVICFEPLYFKPLYCPKLDRFLRFSGICHFKPHSVFKKRK